MKLKQEPRIQLLVFLIEHLETDMVHAQGHAYLCVPLLVGLLSAVLSLLFTGDGMNVLSTELQPQPDQACQADWTHLDLFLHWYLRAGFTSLLCSTWV